MPIYEFKCLVCSEYSELLLINGNKFELKCTHCGAKDLERIISTANYTMPAGSKGLNKGSFNSTKTRSCGSGSCTTYNIPGPA